jgi:peptidoglycan/xylan/chitin deacetylase (PgdA/CDA1 family)
LQYSALNQDERNAALARLTPEFRKRAPERAMLTASDLRKLQKSGVAIGAHSAGHLPLTLVLDPGQDIRHARDWLRENVDRSTAAAMSFPHGRYDRHVVEAARSLDYQLLFTSDAILNLCPGGWIETDLLGRIPIETDPVARAGDGIVEPSLAAWLFLREKRTLSA